MARAKTQFVCQECGAISPRWAGRCESCGGWNGMLEETFNSGPPKGLGSAKGHRVAFVGLKGETPEAPRHVTGVGEFDRVCGGGLVPGTAVLVGGDPGVGKSTLMLQVAASLSVTASTAYISGEEAVEQIRLRARRLGLGEAPMTLAAATSIRDIVASLDTPDGPAAVVIDSIQTMFLDNLESAPGTVTQVRTSAQELIRVAKRRGFAVLLVGHVTKEGLIAGPRVLEHMVDTVLHFEGERGHQFRLLRAVKNRFGATDEIGVFEMSDSGLAEVANPSVLFLADRENPVSGACVFAGMEGTRPVLVEIQSLIAPSALATPRRAVVGWDSGRLAMILAVLQARCGLRIGGSDIYLNIAGGLRISEPAADLSVAAALLSSLSDRPMPEGTVVFGEVGLSGEVRPVSHTENRLKEAAKLGFTRAVTPKRRRGRGETTPGITIQEISHLSDLLTVFGIDAGTGAEAWVAQAHPVALEKNQSQPRNRGDHA